MANNNIILSFAPTIQPSLIDHPDHESNQANEKLIDGSKKRYFQRLGIKEPVVMIGKLKLGQKDVKMMTIRMDEIVPTASVAFIDMGGNFTTGAYPLANTLMSVFVQSTVPQVKSLSMEFLITNISSMPLTGTTAIMYTISGEMHIPKLNGNYSKSFPKMTSKSALMQIAKDLKLGFADNQSEDTNDNMTWLMPNYSYKSAIKHITKLAYRDDDNFFDCFIDRYYVLNFVNVEKQFDTTNKEIDSGYTIIRDGVYDLDKSDPDKETQQPLKESMLLTNDPKASQSENFILDFSLMGSHGEILQRNSLRKYVYWYEHGLNSKDKSKTDDANLVSHFVEPLTSPTENDAKAPHTTLVDEFKTAETTVKVWSGVHYGNAHASYKFAELLNHQNRMETEKNVLKVKLAGLNKNIIRGSRVAVAIFVDRTQSKLGEVIKNDADTQSPEKRDNTAAELSADSKGPGLYPDKGLTDFYYVKSIKYAFINGEFETELMLSRRHWMIPQPEFKSIT